MALKNSAVDYKQLGVSTLNVYVESTGDVSWYPFQVCGLIIICILWFFIISESLSEFLKLMNTFAGINTAT